MFCFKQKTAYDVRISDWSSDVCSSDLETVLRCLHDHLARFAVDVQVGEDQALRRGEVPALAGRGLVVPDVVAGLGFQRHYRRQEQVVALAVAAHLAVPGRTVRSEEHTSELKSLMRISYAFF